MELYIATFHKDTVQAWHVSLGLHFWDHCHKYVQPIWDESRLDSHPQSSTAVPVYILTATLISPEHFGMLGCSGNWARELQRRIRQPLLFWHHRQVLGPSGLVVPFRIWWTRFNSRYLYRLPRDQYWANWNDWHRAHCSMPRGYSRESRTMSGAAEVVGSMQRCRMSGNFWRSHSNPVQTNFNKYKKL